MKTLLTIGFLLLYSVTGLACKCVGKESVQDAYKNSELIVCVKVIKVLGIHDGNDTTILANGDTSVVRPTLGYAKSVEVITVYKGKGFT